MRAFKYYMKRLVIFPSVIITVQSLNVFKRVFGALANSFFDVRKPLVVRTPEERFANLDSLGYTYKPNYVDLSIGGNKKLPRVHYIDEGPENASETILCLHGEPSWSFLYRHMIPPLVASGYRVIAPDFIGFGKSDKFTYQESYSHDLHTLTLRLLIDHLKIKNSTMVCQDWGGLTGLSVVKDLPEAFSRLVIMNTGLPCGTKRLYSPQVIAGFTPFLMWRSLVELFSTQLPIRQVFLRSLIKPTQAIVDAYESPYPSALYMAGAAQWPLLVPVTANTPVAADMKATREYLATNWTHKSALIMFSDRDPITRPSKAMFEGLLPHAAKKTVVGAGHFLQEDKGEECAKNIIAFIDNKL
ncbi:unnamed protein product [Meganyctiphanes norvegica]|uniref:AB hydrolase-1 domain-containing protein n=1 Tax=Meganyctiphanes norvegica TaxID=48144 RepID=A0AAV2QK67_MEGNR